MTVVNAANEEEAIQAIADADAFFGKLTPMMLAAAKQLRWVQSPTASLEHYVFPELVAHPCQLTNMRGLFSDVIADPDMDDATRATGTQRAAPGITRRQQFVRDRLGGPVAHLRPSPTHSRSAPRGGPA